MKPIPFFSRNAQVSNLPTAVFLHGFMGSGADWQALLSRVSSGFQCICIDLPGHGASRFNAAATMSETANALIHFLDEHSIPPCVLIGYSMGGRLALYFAARHPDRVSGLILESASPGLETEGERLERLHQDEKLAQHLESIAPNDAAFSEFIEQWYQQPIFSSLLNKPELYRNLCEQRKTNCPAALAGSLRGMGVGAQPNLWPNLPELNLPALIMAGTEDPKFTDIAKRMASLIPHAVLALLPQCGHMPHLEQTEACTDQMHRFLFNENMGGNGVQPFS